VKPNLHLWFVPLGIIPDMPTTEPTGTEFEPYRLKIEQISDLIAGHAAEAEENRYLNSEVAQAMARAGLYRVAAPRSIGGGEVHPSTQIRVIEAVSEIDGAAGWNLMIGIEVMGILASVYPPALVQRLYADPELIISGALNPLGSATRADGGYLVSGQWPFASGIHNAHYFWGQCIVREEGKPAQDDQGVVLIEALFSQEKFEIVDTWDVAGLRGSGSHDVKVNNLFVPEELVSQVSRHPGHEQGTLYRLPLFSRLAYNKVGVATGIARSAIASFKTLATTKTPRGTFNKLRERTDAQLAIAEAELRLGQARAYVMEATDELWTTVDQRRKPELEQRVKVHLACAGAVADAVSVVSGLYTAAGASANFHSSPLEKHMRDVRVVPQHIMVSSQFTQAAGRVLLGLDSSTFLF
jgi:alkylation response protein AidB-like acyl-CoA dehydrogenase